MTTLSVNVNKIALLRNTRKGKVPDVVRLSRVALEAGAHGITVHPRPDERHIRQSDVTHLAALLREPAWADREFNIEGNPFLGRYVELCRAVKPDQCTLVPDAPEQSTSDHGWQLNDEVEIEQVAKVVTALQALGSRVSLFMDPDPGAIERVPQTGADRVELYTEGYADALAGGLDSAAAEAVHRRYADAASRAQQLGLGVNGGHDLNLHNLRQFVTIPGILEVSIGHALIADALELGMAETVRAYRAMLDQALPAG